MHSAFMINKRRAESLMTNVHVATLLALINDHGLPTPTTDITNDDITVLWWTPRPRAALSAWINTDGALTVFWVSLVDTSGADSLYPNIETRQFECDSMAAFLAYLQEKVVP